MDICSGFLFLWREEIETSSLWGSSVICSCAALDTSQRAVVLVYVFSGVDCPLGLIKIFVPKQLYFGEFPVWPELLCELTGVRG